MPAFVEPFRDPAVEAAEETEPRALQVDGSVFAVEWASDNRRIALSVAPRPLIDDSYMFRRVHVVDVESGERLALLENPGKLGAVAFSPDGKFVAMISALDPNDPADGRLMVAPASGGPLRDRVPGLLGHISAIAWRSAEELQFVADVGVETKLGVVPANGGTPSMVIESGPVADGSGRIPILSGLSLSRNGLHAAFAGETPSRPREVYVLGPDDEIPRRLTDSNPWLAGVGLGEQEVVTWRSQNSLGLELQGILIRPLHGDLGDPPPLIMTVHGGPEGHVRNGWNASYSRPGQLAAGAGFAVFYPNYRGSTGRGVEFSKLGQSDAAGKEFDDLVEGVDYLVAQGLADADRVGIHGGSYGGYATAWCATRYTEKFRAGVMFVGISNKLSKALTTDIPLEDQMVHTRYDPWTRMDFSMERSPLSYADKGRTPLLIAGGTSDTRVHPSQSLQFYRALKLVGETPVRYGRYPGEGHGNRRAASRDDYSRRLMRWMHHFLVDGATELPPWNLGLGEEETDDEKEDD
jgi:dipeptidyl aminopeptidase/acylaminoacyl peptidase